MFDISATSMHRLHGKKTMPKFCCCSWLGMNRLKHELNHLRRSQVRIKSLTIAILLILSPSAFADEPTDVQVRLLYRATEGKAESKIEPWIVMGVTKSSDEVALPMTGWVKLTSDEERVYSANGCYIDGKVVAKNGKYRVKLDGCNGGQLKMRATLKPGERGVYRLNFTDDLFVAVTTPSE